jgi:F-type H+-transporting ATPase subunit gamma
MANTRDIRRRIKSVKSTAQITKAMQMVAAAKMRKAQQAALSARPYIRLLERTLVHIHAALMDQDAVHPLLSEPDPDAKGRHLVYVVSTDRGLCGGLNTNLIREMMKLDPATTDFVVSGRKVRVALQRLRRNIVADFELRDTPTFAEVKQVAKFLMQRFLSGDAFRVSVLFTNFVSTLSQVPRTLPILPLSAVADLARSRDDEAVARETEFLFEPNTRAILDVLLPHYFNTNIYTLVLDARASEHSARMVAMKNATDNAKELIKDLTLQYNKVRQSSITAEILEISSAQLAMGS